MKKIGLAIAAGILGLVFGSSLVWSQPHIPRNYHGGAALQDVQDSPPV